MKGFKKFMDCILLKKLMTRNHLFFYTSIKQNLQSNGVLLNKTAIKDENRIQCIGFKKRNTAYF